MQNAPHPLKNEYCPAFCDHQTTCITLVFSVSLPQVSWHIGPSARLSQSNSLDSRGRSHPAILSIWEHINFQKPWIGGSSHHMCLSVPFSLCPPQWLPELLSNISPILPDVRNHWLDRVSSASKSSFVSHSRIYSITFAFNFSAIFSLEEISHFLGGTLFWKGPWFNTS